MTVSAFKMNTFSNKYRILMDNLDLMFGHVAVNDNYRTSIKITAADLRGVFFFFCYLDQYCYHHPTFSPSIAFRALTVGVKTMKLFVHKQYF